MWSYTYSQDRSFSDSVSDLTSYWGSTIEPYISNSGNNYIFKTTISIGVKICKQNIGIVSKYMIKNPYHTLLGHPIFIYM